MTATPVLDLVRLRDLPANERDSALSGISALLEGSSAEEIAAWAADAFGMDVIVAASMQDVVLPHLFAQVLPGIEVLFLETGYHFPETLLTRDRAARALPITLVQALPRQTVAEQDAEYGANLHDRDPNLCCFLRKVEPLARSLEGRAAWVTGVRRVEGPTRADTPIVSWDDRHGLVKVNPLVAWSDEDVAAYQVEHDLPRNALVAQGYPSIGCAPCTRKVAPGEDPRAGRWSGNDKTECGIHASTVVEPQQAEAKPETRLTLDHLDALESESIHIFREVAAEFERPVVLFSGGKDSVVMLHLAAKAFWPAPVPFPLLHVDTGHNFPEVLAFRDRAVGEKGVRLEVAMVQDYIDDGRLTERTDGTRNPLQTQPLLDAIADHRFDAVFGGGRRDEEKARAKERIFSLRDEFGAWDPRNQRPELWNLYNGKHRPGEHVRVFPLSNWTELDVWRYIAREDIELPTLYYAHEREVFERDGMLLAVGPVSLPRETESVVTKQVRYRTVGDMSCTGAVESDAVNVQDVVIEVAATRLTERGATRADDRISEAAMEDRKKEGYF